MRIDNIQDVDVLQQMLKMQLKESERLKVQLAAAHSQLQLKDGTEAEQLALKLSQIEKQHAAALKKLFGQSSERSREERTGTPKAKKPQTGHGRTPQRKLFCEDVLHELNVNGHRCELCKKGLSEWHGQFDDSEEIDFVAPELIIKRHRRKKYRCNCGSCILTAPGPQKLFKKARYSINFAINVALQKYCYHMPLARQVKELSRYNLTVTTATLWDYMDKLHELLKPAYERLPEYILSKSVVGVDETSWRLLKSDKKGKSKKWWVWARRVEDAVHYTLDASRGGQTAGKLLANYEGTVVCDGYQVYETLARDNPKLNLANCWAHARRELLPYELNPQARRALRVIQRLYSLERVAKDRKLSPEEWLIWRRRKTKPLLVAFFRWLDSQKTPPTSELRNAFLYIQKRQAALLRFVDDVNISPDNNATERVMRPIVLGRKNHYGSRSERGTQVAAVFFSLLESAGLAGHNPHEYLHTAVSAALSGAEVPLPHEVV